MKPNELETTTNLKDVLIEPALAVGEGSQFSKAHVMNGDSGVVFAARLLIKAAPSFFDSAGTPKQELAQTLGAISVYLTDIASALRLGSSPISSLGQLRAKTITFIILAREIVPEQTARGIARQLVSGTRFATPLSDDDRSGAIASDYETAAKLFKQVADQMA